MPLLIRNARVLTLAQPGPRRGREAMNDLGVLPWADVLIEGIRISTVEAAASPTPCLRASVPDSLSVLDARGRVLMPGFADCHTHACWAGERLDEWELKRKGVPYLDILKSGGGIMSTVRAVREESCERLSAALTDRLRHMLAHGSTTIETKSGYGLSAEHELKMLEAIGRAAKQPGAPTVVPTALLGHAIDPDDSLRFRDRPEESDFVARTIREALSTVSMVYPNIAIDAFCEQGAWSLADCLRLFKAAKAAGHHIRVHADQFNSLGMVPEAIRLGALSVDHLEATTPSDLKLLAESGTFGVMLPSTGFHTDGRYADGRGFVDAGGQLAIATNYNPGSSPCPSMPMAIALAVRFNRLTPAEAVIAATLNPACLLGFADRGRIAPGQRADLVLLRHTDERMLAYEFGGNPVDTVILGGRAVVSERAVRCEDDSPQRHRDTERDALF